MLLLFTSRTCSASQAGIRFCWMTAVCLTLWLHAGFSQLAHAQNAGQNASKHDWYDASDWGLEGKGWTEETSYYTRLPDRAKGVVPDPVWGLSRHSAGLVLQFRTNATEIIADLVPTNKGPHTQANMTPIAQSGLDVYAKDADGQWKWAGVFSPNPNSTISTIVSGFEAVERDYMIYLPLYNGTESLKIGVPAGSTFVKTPPRSERPIVFYGTSITQGASASRPGMPHPAILGRRLNLPVINLGFSGNGRMEESFGKFLIELDPAVFVIDCLPNMNATQVSERAAPLVRQIRAAHPETPIILIEDRTYANAHFKPDVQKRQTDSRAALKAAYAELQAENVQKLWYLNGEELLGADREDTIDSSHPSDLGFVRQADAIEPLLREALGR